MYQCAHGIVTFSSHARVKLQRAHKSKQRKTWKTSFSFPSISISEFSLFGGALPTHTSPTLRFYLRVESHARRANCGIARSKRSPRSSNLQIGPDSALRSLSSPSNSATPTYLRWLGSRAARRRQARYRRLRDVRRTRRLDSQEAVYL